MYKRQGIDRDLTAGLLLFPFAERFVHFLLFLLVVLFRVSLHFVDEMVDLIAEILLAWSACVVLFHNRLLLMFTEHDSKTVSYTHLYAGTVTAPKNIGESINEAVVAAREAARAIKE